MSMQHVLLRKLAAMVWLAGLISLAACTSSDAPAVLESVTVYKSPTCGCCENWVRHLRASGFEVRTIDRPDLADIKTEAGISRGLASCHTAFVDDYVIEGHVPATDIRRLLRERPAVAGLTVPGMPMGSPGMEGPRKDPYEVLTFTRSGETAVYARY